MKFELNTIPIYWSREVNITWDTFPLPVKTNVKGPKEGGIIPSAISYPASRIPCLKKRENIYQRFIKIFSKIVHIELTFSF